MDEENKSEVDGEEVKELYCVTCQKKLAAKDFYKDNEKQYLNFGP